jgi:glycosyltransferase involved in cell wall biosynthesis/tetratricopeptide (TPR) repeat protein
VRRYLFGPITASFAEQNLFSQRQAGSCRAFGTEPGLDLVIGPGDTWEHVASRFPAGWQPDFIVLFLWYTTIPRGLWSTPVPIVGLAGDWNLLWHYYRQRLPACDLVLTDTLGAELMALEGITHARVANLFGLERAWLEPETRGQESEVRSQKSEAREGTTHHSPLTTHQRDIDVLFIGNLHPAVQRDRLPWLARLAQLGDRWNVQIYQGIFGEQYKQLLRRTRIVFNRGIRGECNMRTFEAAAAGALLFQEAENREVQAYFRDRQECVYYTDENLEELLEYYLEHEDDRRSIAEVAQAKVAEYAFEKLWDRALAVIDEELPRIRGQKSKARGQRKNRRCVHGDVWEALCSTAEPDPRLATELAAELVERPRDADLHNALGLVAAAEAQRQRLSLSEQARRAVGYFKRAVDHAPGNLMAGLNLVEALVVLGDKKRAIEQAKATLERLDRLAVGQRTSRKDAKTAKEDAKLGFAASATLHEDSWIDAGHFPLAFDFFRVEWERTAWIHAGRPRAEMRAKLDLIRWRLHALLAELTGKLDHYYEAVAARPDLPTSQAALGCTLARERRFADAVPHLRRSVESSPFDLNAARALSQALGEAGDADGQRELTRERALLAKAAPRIVPPELWFQQERVPSPSSAVRSQKDNPPRPSLLQTTDLGARTALVWQGPVQAVHSLGFVNREVCRRLIERGHELALVAVEPPAEEVPRVALPPSLCDRIGCKLSRPADVDVRHQWPPDFMRPSEGRLVIFQHWEFGSLPQAWIEPMSRQVDEVWVASRYARDCFVKSGVPAERVQVIPLGIDGKRLHPEAPPLKLPTGKRFKFLFVGGTIYRKGIDLLLDAYTRGFRRRDDVCLVIKDMGVGSFYRGQTAEKRIAELQAKAEAPEIVYLKESLSEDELAGLYTACDCLVHPYRGEGFGLPIAEAMACGLPAIVTGHGAALDFCYEKNAFLLPARVVRFREKRLGDLETVDHPWLAEPDVEALEAQLRYIVEHPAEARAKGQAAHAHIHAHFTWEHTADAVEARLREMVRSPWSVVRSKDSHNPSCAGVKGETSRLRTTDHGLRTPKVSLCMIVKNEEANLPACLQSAEGIFDEKIIIDTGSTDRTKEIAQSFGAQVHDFPWVDSFAAARNESLRHATGDWVFWLDADDRLDDANRARLATLLRTLSEEDASVDQTHPDAFVMKCVCLPDPETGMTTVVDHVRLFRNHPNIRWEHRIHEQILPAIRRAGGTVQFTDIVINHAGYQDRVVRQRKRERDLRLLLLEYAEQPDHPFTLFNLGSSYLDLSRPAEALPYLERSLERSEPADSIVRKLYYLIVQCHRQLRQPEEALAVCQKGRSHYPEDAELLNQEAQLKSQQGDLAGAEASFLQLLHGSEKAHFASIPEGLRGHITRHNLAVIYKQQGRNAEAEAQWRTVLREVPDYLPARLGLGELCLEQQRWGELEEVASRLDSDGREPIEGQLFRARAYLARQEFAEARQLLEEMIEVHPTALRPHVLLTHVLLQEGRDPAAAENALRAVLALDPNHAEARHNLAVVCQRNGVARQPMAASAT